MSARPDDLAGPGPNGQVKRSMPFKVEWVNALRAPSSGAPRSALNVAETLASHMDLDGSSCFPSVAVIRAESRIGRATVFRALAWLTEAGWVVIHHRGRRGGGRLASRYEPRIPSLAPVVDIHNQRSHSETFARGGEPKVSPRDDQRSHGETGKALVTRPVDQDTRVANALLVQVRAYAAARRIDPRTATWDPPAVTDPGQTVADTDDGGGDLPDVRATIARPTNPPAWKQGPVPVAASTVPVRDVHRGKRRLPADPVPPPDPRPGDLPAPAADRPGRRRRRRPTWVSNARFR